MRSSDWSSYVCSSDLKSSCTPPPSGADLTLTSSIGVGEGYGETGLFGGAAGLRRAGAGGVQRIEERQRLGQRIARRGREGERDAAEDGRHRRRLGRSEEHTSELQSLTRNSYAVSCLKQNTKAAQQDYCPDRDHDRRCVRQRGQVSRQGC